MTTCTNRMIIFRNEWDDEWHPSKQDDYTLEAIGHLLDLDPGSTLVLVPQDSERKYGTLSYRYARHGEEVSD